MTRIPPPILGEFEQIVMLALVRLGSDAYGATVCAAAEDGAQDAGGEHQTDDDPEEAADLAQETGAAIGSLGRGPWLVLWPPGGAAVTLPAVPAPVRRGPVGLG